MSDGGRVSSFAHERSAKIFKTKDGREIRANLTELPILIAPPSPEDLVRLIKRFREIHLRWLLDYLSAEAEASYHNGPREYAPLFGLSYSTRKKQLGGTAYVFRHLRANAIPDEAWAACGLGSIPRGERLSAMFSRNTPHDKQKAFIAATLGKTAASAAAVLKAPEILVFPEMEEALQTSGSVQEFFERMASIAASDQLRDEAEDQPKSGAYKIFIPSAFMFFAAQEGLLLLSPQRQMFSGGFERRELYMRLARSDINGFEELRRISLSKNMKKVEAKHSLPLNHSPMTALLTMTSCTTMRSEADISAELFEKVRDVVDRLVENHGKDYYQVVFFFLNSKRKSDDRLPDRLPERNSANRSLGLAFGWTKMTRGETSGAYFPKSVPGDYKARTDIVGWASWFEKYLGSKENKAFSPIQSSLQKFLLWLHESGIIAHDFAGLDRAFINDGYVDPSTSKCFRAYLERLSCKPKTKNVILSNVAAAFEWLIATRGLVPNNPIKLSFDSFKTGQARGRSVRNCIPREIAEMLKERNRRDDFALSRSFKKHMRTPLAGDGTPEWFPGVAILLDLLLCLPLRGFQARFLDSGEGDQMITVRNDAGQLTQIRNPAKTMIPGQREGCLDFIPASFTSPPRLGLYINTNKTSETANAGYRIPWCPPDLEANIRRMIAWQSERNAVSEPVPCMDKNDYERHMNRSLVHAVKKTFALFRDPDEAKGWPISRKSLYEYWDLLQATVEDEMTRTGRPVRLTELVSRDGKMVRKGVFDIHSLRVTGITALLEAGLSPDIVMEVAGHATIVMTLYYNKVDNERIAREIDAARRRTIELVEGGESSPAEMKGLGLFNTRSEADAAGMEILSDLPGRSAGGVSVMSHGICPGGDCSTGGAYDQSSRTHGPVEPGACSLCRYRLTGPAFLPGLVLNANRLMFELHSTAKQIAETNKKIGEVAAPSSASSRLRGVVEVLTRKTDALASEWAAEVQYAQMAKAMLEETPAGGTDKALPIVGDLRLALEKRHEFVLLQTLAEGYEESVDFRPTGAIEQHRLFLSELSMASNASPFLLSLPCSLRDKAAVMLGRAICDLLPDETLYGLSDGSVQPDEKLKQLSASVEARMLSVNLDDPMKKLNDK